MNTIYRTPFTKLALVSLLTIPAAVMAQPDYPYHGMMMGPGMWQNMTPEQQQQMQARMLQNRQEMWQSLSPEQQQRMRDSMQQMWGMHRQGMGPGMMMGNPGWRPMTPEEYKSWWDRLYAPAAAPGKR